MSSSTASAATIPSLVRASREADPPAYGIRVSELGDYSMEYDLKTPEQQAEVCNVVRFAIDRSRLTQEHLDCNRSC